MNEAAVTGHDRPRIVVSVCTYNRHEPLAILLEALVANARHLAERAAVGVVVVDDSKDGNARGVVARFEDRFELGIHYRISGRQNIALARNTGLEGALGLAADWIAMTDDDCEPVPHWLESLLEIQRRTNAGAVTGVLRRRPPPGSPRWLTDEPFLDAGLGAEKIEDGAEMPLGATHNSLISAQWLREHPEIRFDPSFGITGGEDPVFYRTARAAGLRIHNSRKAEVYENEPPSRATLGYQLRLFFWLGNNSYITNVGRGVHPLRMVVHGVRLVASSLVRPVRKIVQGEFPHLRYALALALQGMGVVTGAVGVRVKHK
jgi:succinoglycan biosynthesis protein ExoM